jgi:hypothetical protein
MHSGQEKSSLFEGHETKGDDSPVGAARREEIMGDEVSRDETIKEGDISVTMFDSPIESEKVGQQNRSGKNSIKSDFHQPRMSFEIKSPTLGLHQKSWAANSRNEKTIHISLSLPNSNSQTWTNQRGSPKHIDKPPVVAFSGKETKVCCATIETPSTLSVASLRASFNARASSQPPKPVPCSDIRKGYGLTGKKNVKTAIRCASVELEQRCRSSASVLESVSHIGNVPASNNIVASTRVDSFGESLNEFENMNAETIAGMQTAHLALERHVHNAVCILPNSQRQTKISFPSSQSQNIGIETVGGELVSDIEKNTGVQNSCFVPSDTHDEVEYTGGHLLDDLHQSSNRGHQLSSSLKGNSSPAQIAIGSSLAVDFDEPIPSAPDFESYVDYDSMSKESKRKYQGSTPRNLPADVLKLSAPSQVELSVRTEKTLHSRVISNGQSTRSAATAAVCHNEVLCELKSQPDNESMLVSDDSAPQAEYQKYIFNVIGSGDPRPAYFDHDGWPIRNGALPPSHEKCNGIDHLEPNFDGFDECSENLSGYSRDEKGTGPTGSKPFRETSQQSQALVLKSVYPQRQTGQLRSFERAQNNLRKPPPFDPFADEPASSSFEDTDVFSPPAEEFSPVNWDADSFQQSFEI